MKTIFLYFLCYFVIEINMSASSYFQEIPSNIHWGFLADEGEGVIKVYFNVYINQMCREKTDDITINRTSIFKGKTYVSITSSKFELTYDEAEFYHEDKQGKLHKISKEESINKISVALMIEKGKATEIKIDLPKNCPLGDYLLKIKVHNEQGERYEIYRWFEAYTSKQISQRQKFIPIKPGYDAPAIGDITEDNEEEIFEVVQNMPEFPGGGMPKLMQFIQSNLQYERTKNGTRKYVIVQIIIDKDGTVIHPKIIRGVNPNLDKEALRVMNLMPKWKPGSQHEVPVKVRFTLPVIFDSPAN